MSVSNLESDLPSNVSSLLHVYDDVFSEETLMGFPPIRRIEHQIDFVPGASLPNRPAYRITPVETNELKKKSVSLWRGLHP